MINAANDVIWTSLIQKNRLTVSISGEIKTSVLFIYCIFLSFFFFFEAFTNIFHDHFLETCETIFVDAKNTVGMLVVNHPLHGKCTNLDAIDGIKQCSGTCQSSTYFDSGNDTYKINFSIDTLLPQWLI